MSESGAEDRSHRLLQHKINRGRSQFLPDITRVINSGPNRHGAKKLIQRDRPGTVVDRAGHHTTQTRCQREHAGAFANHLEAGLPHHAA